jgi:hypothetical protein
LVNKVQTPIVNILSKFSKIVTLQNIGVHQYWNDTASHIVEKSGLWNVIGQFERVEPWMAQSAEIHVVM